MQDESIESKTEYVNSTMFKDKKSISKAMFFIDNLSSYF